MLSVGIVGLPNVGKSTLFNALTAGHANVSNYPFTTIDSNLGVVPVPDQRLRELEAILKPQESTPCFIEFIDIAGLVEGASRGEGLGNQFLGNIRQVDAIVHLVRSFPDADVAHVFSEVDPLRDVDVVETELLLADLDLIGRALEKRERQSKGNPKAFAAERERLLSYRCQLEQGKPLRVLDLDREGRQELKSLGLLTGKPVLYVLNVSEAGYTGGDDPAASALREHAASPGAQTLAGTVSVSAKIEAELMQLDPDDRSQFMRELGIERTGLERLVERAFVLLGLIRFYTIVNQKLRAWEIEDGTPAPQAAGKIHTDMEHGFIRAQVVGFEELREHGSFQELHRHGLVRTEGKDYRVQDGDVVEFLFSG